MFETFEDERLCMQKIQSKLASHCESDIREKNKRGDIPTITPLDALSLLVESQGICSFCNINCKLHSWEVRDPEQFTFDRINDNDTHHAGNLQIACLRCNVRNADLIYGPDYEIEFHRGSGPAYDEYERRKEEFNKLEDEYYKKIPRVVVPREISRYHFDLKCHMAYLHELIYGNRKKNGWLRAGVFPSTRPPILKLPVPQHGH